MSIGREESLFLTVSEDHRKRTYPEYVQKMSEPFERAGGMVEVYEGVVLGGADKFFGLDDLNLWLRRHRYAAYDMDVLRLIDAFQGMGLFVGSVCVTMYTAHPDV